MAQESASSPAPGQPLRISAISSFLIAIQFDFVKLSVRSFELDPGSGDIVTGREVPAAPTSQSPSPNRGGSSGQAGSARRGTVDLT